MTNFISKTIILFLCATCLITSGCSKGSSQDFSDTQNTTITSQETKKEKKIEITLENWDTYFEFVEKVQGYKNEYNETEYVCSNHYFVLKDKYVMASSGTDIALEYSYHTAKYKVKEDLTKETIIWGEYIENTKEDLIEEARIKRSETSVANNALLSHDSKYRRSDLQVLRIYGTLSIIE